MNENWPVRALGQVAEIQMGQSPPGHTYNVDGVGLPFMQGSAEFGEHFPTPVKWCSQPAKIAEVGDLLVSVRAPVGDTNFADQRIAIGRGLAAVRARPGAETGFLRLLIQVRTADLLARSGTGMFSSITGKNLREFEVPVPVLKEQKRIVDLVASVDACIAGLEKQVEATRTARNAVLHELISSLSLHSPKVALGDVLEISRGGSPRPIDSYITDDADGINWVKIGDATVSSKYIYETNQKIRPDGARRSREVSPGDFLLSNSMSFGRPYIMRTSGCIHDGWLLMSGVSSHFDEDYLYNVLLSQDVQLQFESLAAGSGVRNLNIGVVNSVTVPLPSRDEQKAVAEIANELDSFVLKSEETLTAAVTARAAVIDSLLSGEHQIPDSYDKFLGAA